MKSKILKLLLILLLGASLVMLTACGEEEKEEEETPDIKDISILTYVNEAIENGDFNLIDKNKVVESFCDEINYKLLSDKVYGDLTIAINDYDRDGEDEAVVVNINEDDNIVFELYKVENKKLELKDRYEILDTLLTSSNELEFSVFAKENDDKIDLYYEASGSSNIFANGVMWRFAKISVTGSEFIVSNELEYDGSMIMEDDEDELVAGMQDAGLEVKKYNLGSINAVFQDEYTVELGIINRVNTDEYNAILRGDLSAEKSEKTRYGHTLYTNCIYNEGYGFSVDKIDVSDKIYGCTYNEITENEEYDCISFDGDKNVTQGIFEYEEGTFEIVGNRIATEFDGVTRYYRIIDENLIYNVSIYEEVKN